MDIYFLNSDSSIDLISFAAEEKLNVENPNNHP